MVGIHKYYTIPQVYTHTHHVPLLIDHEARRLAGDRRPLHHISRGRIVVVIILESSIYLLRVGKQSARVLGRSPSPIFPLRSKKSLAWSPDRTNTTNSQTSCFTNAVANSTCSETDLSCICSNDKTIITTMETCTNVNCTVNQELSEYL